MEISVFDMQPADTSHKAAPNAQGADAPDVEGSSFEDIVAAQDSDIGVPLEENVSSTELSAPMTEEELDGAGDHVSGELDLCCQEYAAYQDQLPAISSDAAVDKEDAAGQVESSGSDSASGVSPLPVIVPAYPLLEAHADVVEPVPETGAMDNAESASGVSDAADGPRDGPDGLLEMSAVNDGVVAVTSSAKIPVTDPDGLPEVSAANDGVEAETSSAKIPVPDPDGLPEMSADNDGFDIELPVPVQAEETDASTQAKSVSEDFVSKVGPGTDRGLARAVSDPQQSKSGTERIATENQVEVGASMDDAGADVNADASGGGPKDGGPVARLLNMTSPGSTAQTEGSAVSFDKVASQAVQAPRTPGSTVDPAAIYEKFDDGLRLSVAGGGKEVRITLHPENLGHLRIKLQVEQNVVNARITVDSVEVKVMLEADASKLKELFGAQGLVLDKYSIGLSLNGSGLNDSEWSGHDWTGAPAGDGRRADKANDNEGNGSVSVVKTYAHPGTFGTGAAGGIDVFV